MSSVLMLVCVC